MAAAAAAAAVTDGDTTLVSCKLATKLRCAHLPQYLWVANIALIDLVKGQVILALPQLLLVCRALDGDRASHCQTREASGPRVGGREGG